MKPEQAFYQMIRPHLLGHVQRIENTAGDGAPDLNICYGGKEMWVELKVAISGEVVLRKEQYAWMTRRHQNLGKCFVIALHGDLIRIYVAPFDVTPHGTGKKYVRLQGYYEWCPKSVIGKTLETFLFTR